MVIIRGRIFEKYTDVIFGFNTKLGGEREGPYYFNMSLSVDDNPQIVKENRELFFSALGLKTENIAFQRQVHGDRIQYVDKPGFCGDSDAVITDKKMLGLAVSTADCTPVFIYDKKKKVIAGIHSGWRSTEKRIVEKTIVKLKEDFYSDPADLIVYIGPSISQQNYEVGKEVADLFDKKYTKPYNDKFLLDVAGVNYDMLKNAGVTEENIGKSHFCNYSEKYLFHSYRREGLKSGRSLGVIALK